MEQIEKGCVAGGGGSPVTHKPESAVGRGAERRLRKGLAKRPDSLTDSWNFGAMSAQGW